MDQKIIEALALLRQNPSFRVLQKYQPREQYYSDPECTPLVGIYLDIETTGLNSKKDKIIELSMVRFEFLPDGRIFRILDTYEALHDPGFPLPQKIVSLTGISDKMVQGKKIDPKDVERMAKGAVIVIAHHANFDRKFVERQWDIFKKLPWACSIKDIDWLSEGINGTKLDYLAFRFGFFFEGHRAVNDCLAGIHLLSMILPESQEPALKALLDKARQKEYRIWAEHSPFECKDILNERGYIWNYEGSPKAWYIDVPGEQRQSEINFLFEEIYGCEVTLRIDTITAFTRYSDRV